MWRSSLKFSKTSPPAEDGAQIKPPPQVDHKNLYSRGQVASFLQGNNCPLEEKYLNALTETARDISLRGIFSSKAVIIFANPSSNIANLKLWLETVFDLYVTVVRDTEHFNEWLFRFAGLADLVVVDRDSFTDELPTFSRFLRTAKDVCEETPVIVISKEFEGNDLKSGGDEAGHIRLRAPVTHSMLCLAVLEAADIILNGT